MTTTLDQVMPSFHHRVRHGRWIDAPPEAVWEALHRLGFDELRVSLVLLALRSLPARLLGRAEHRPVGRFLAGFQARGFTVLAERPGRELVGGWIGRYWKPAAAERAPVGGLAEFVAFTKPGWAKLANDFRLEPERGGTRLSTETRVVATDPSAWRAFAAYWLLIRIGSGLIRRDLLRAIARRSVRGTVAATRTVAEPHRRSR